MKRFLVVEMTMNNTSVAHKLIAIESYGNSDFNSKTKFIVLHLMKRNTALMDSALLALQIQEQNNVQYTVYSQ